MIWIARREKILMKRYIPSIKGKEFVTRCSMDCYILFLKTMKLLVNNKTQPYSSSQMFNKIYLCKPHHGSIVIAWRKNSFKTLPINKESLMCLEIRRKIRKIVNGKILIQKRIATLIKYWDLILLNHISKLLLAKKRNQILGTSDSVLL